jgi:predicted RNA methylase
MKSIQNNPTNDDLSVVSQKKGLQRNTIDKYYTKPSVAEQCIVQIQQTLQIDKNDVIIEPSAGNGAFIPFIQPLVDTSLFFDIAPEHPSIIQQNYLEYQPTMTSKIHVIGNPPFGRQSSFAIQFIKKSCEFCDSVSFILPKSFKKPSMQNHFPRQFHLLLEEDLPDKSFLVDKIEHDVPCVFQIWEKRDTLRELPERTAAQGFRFVKKSENPHISVRRVGVNAGKIDTDTDKSEQSHYFIQFTNGASVADCNTGFASQNLVLNGDFVHQHRPSGDARLRAFQALRPVHLKSEAFQTEVNLHKILQNVEKLKNIIFTHNNTVGPKSISKEECIREFNRCLE